MNFLRAWRNESFKELGKSRIKRITMCGFVIASIWCFADYMSGSLGLKLRDDFICLVLAILAERCIPWGKEQQSSSMNLNVAKEN